MRSHILTIAAIAGLAFPVAGIAQVYLTPEQVLQQSNGSFVVPSHQRGAEWAASLEAQLNQERHPVVAHDPSDPVQDNGVPPPVNIDELRAAAAAAPAPATNGLDPITARLLARLAQQNSILASGAAAAGSPLAQTGPAAILSIIAMGAATFITLRRARLLERFVGDY